MAEKLSVQIELAGGQEVARQLEGIGKAGQKCFNDISAAAEKVGGFKNLNLDEVTNKLKTTANVTTQEIAKIQAAVQGAGRLEIVVGGLQAAEQQFEKLGETVEKSMAKMTRSMGPIGALARALGPVGIAAGLLGASMVKGVVDAVAAIDQLNAAAAKLGTTTEKLSQLRAAFAGTGITTEGLVAGLEKIKSAADAITLDKLKKGFEELKAALASGVSIGDASQLRELMEAAKGFGPVAIEARKMLNELGAGVPGTTKQDVRDLGVELAKLKGIGFDIKVGQDTNQRLLAIVDGLSRMPEGAERSAIAMQHLGDATGAMVIDMLRAGVALDEVKAKAAAGGGGITPEQIEAAARYNVAINNLSESWKNFNSVAVAPVLTGVFNELTSQINKIKSDLADLTAGKGFVKFDFAGSGFGQLLQALGLITGDELKAVDASLNSVTQSAQQTTAAVNVTAQAVKQIGQSAQGVQQAGQAFTTWAQLLAAAGGDANKAAEALRQLQSAATQSGSAGKQTGEQVAAGAKTAVVSIDELSRKLTELTTKQISVQVVPINWSLVTQGLDAAVTQISTAFNSIVPNMNFDAVITGAQTAATAVQSVFQNITLPDFAAALQTVWDTIIAGANTAAGGIATAFSNISFQGLISQIDLAIAAMKALEAAALAAAAAAAAAAAGGGGGAPAAPGGGGGLAGGGFIRGPGSATSDSIPAWLSRGEFVINAAAVKYFGRGFFAALNSFRMPAGAMSGGGGFAAGGEAGGGGGTVRVTSSVEKIVTAVDTLAQRVDEGFTEMIRALGSLGDNLKVVHSDVQTVYLDMAKEESLKALYAYIKVGFGQILEGLKAAIAAASAAASAGKKASGGLLGGRGSGTSDSNLAWVSRGEYITPARAVRQPGVLAFLEALRRSGGNLRAVLDGMGHFALGGMVPRPMPAFASGRLAGGMSNVTIQFPGLPAIGGLRAPAVVVDELRHAAALAQVRSGGRKPSRYS